MTTHLSAAVALGSAWLAYASNQASTAAPALHIHVDNDSMTPLVSCNILVQHHAASSICLSAASLHVRMIELVSYAGATNPKQLASWHQLHSLLTLLVCV